MKSFVNDLYGYDFTENRKKRTRKRMLAVKKVNKTGECNK